MTQAARAQSDASGASGEQVERRVVAIILPELLTELASARLSTPVSSSRFQSEGSAQRRQADRRRGSLARRSAALPLGVLLVDSVAKGEGAEASDGDTAQQDLPGKGILAAVNHTAESFGVRVGQTVTEAHAFVARLVVREVTRAQLLSRLGEVAEVALGFGPTVSIEAPDTVWVDVTGASHLAGGEEALALELAGRVRALGHAVRVGVANGPRLAQAFARWGRLNREGCLVVPREETARLVHELPVRALPIDAERAAWLVRLGVLTFGAVSALPRAAAASRLGDMASSVLDLAEGRDDSPLVAYIPPSIPHEETAWDEPIDGTEPLLFVLRGLVSRLSARLEGRGEAVQSLNVVISHDRAISRLSGVSPETALHFDLQLPYTEQKNYSECSRCGWGERRWSRPRLGYGSKREPSRVHSRFNSTCLDTLPDWGVTSPKARRPFPFFSESSSPISAKRKWGLFRSKARIGPRKRVVSRRSHRARSSLKAENPCPV